MEAAFHQFLAQGADWIESVVVLGFIALSVVGNIANAWIKRIKEKRENDRQTGEATPPPSARPRQATRQAFPMAKPRVPHQPAPRPTVAQPVRPTPPSKQPPAPPTPPTRGIPGELLPEGLEEVLGEMLPDFLQPRKPVPPKQKPQSPEAKPVTARPASPPQARKPRTRKKSLADSEASAGNAGSEGVSERLGSLQSSFESQAPQKSTVAAHVAEHISHLKHPVSDVAPRTTGATRERFTRKELRRAIVMNEILGKPRALRPLDDLA